MSYASQITSIFAALSRLRFGSEESSPCQGRVLLSDDFVNLDSDVWGAAGCEDCLGQPQSAHIALVDGKTALLMRSDMLKRQRRGYGTFQAFPAFSLRIEVEFKAISGVDGILELWLTNPENGNQIGMGVYGSRWGILRQVITNCSIDVSSASDSNAWNYGEWYKFVIESNDTSTRLSFRSTRDLELWGHTYAWSLNKLGSHLRVNLSQHIIGPSSGTWKAEAAVDFVRVSANYVLADEKPVAPQEIFARRLAKSGAVSR